MVSEKFQTLSEARNFFERKTLSVTRLDSIASHAGVLGELVLRPTGAPSKY